MFAASSSFNARLILSDTTGARYVFTQAPYPQGQEPSTRPPPEQLDPQFGGLTYTEAMRTMIQKPKIDQMTIQEPKPPLNIRYNNVKEVCYHIDPRTGEKIVMGETHTKRVGEYKINDILKPYYDDVNYCSNASNTDSQKLRSKTPDQLINKFDPLPSDDIQKKIDFFFKPYSVGQVQKKFMTFNYNERLELLQALKKKVNNYELPQEERQDLAELYNDIKDNKNWYEDITYENPAYSIHNLIFQDNDKKRKLVMEQLKDFEIKKMKETGKTPVNKEKLMKRVTKGQMRKDKNNSLGRLFVEQNRNKIGFISVSFKDNQKNCGTSRTKKSQRKSIDSNVDKSNSQSQHLLITPGPSESHNTKQNNNNHNTQVHVHEVVVRPEEYFSGYFAKNQPKPEGVEQEIDEDFQRDFGRRASEKNKMQRGLKDILGQKIKIKKMDDDTKIAMKHREKRLKLEQNFYKKHKQKREIHGQASPNENARIQSQRLTATPEPQTRNLTEEQKIPFDNRKSVNVMKHVQAQQSERLSNPYQSSQRKQVVSSSFQNFQNLPKISAKFNPGETPDPTSFMNQKFSLGNTTHASTNRRFKLPNSANRQNIGTIPVNQSTANTMSLRVSREGRNMNTIIQNTDRKDSTFPSLERTPETPTPTKMKVNTKLNAKQRPYSVLNTVKSKKLELIPKINASKEDVIFYKMLRLTDSYVGMDKVDFEVKRGKSRGGAEKSPGVKVNIDHKRQSNPNSTLNHLFQKEMEMMTNGVKTQTKKYKQLKKLAQDMNKQELILNKMVSVKKSATLQEAKKHS